MTGPGNNCQCRQLALLRQYRPPPPLAGSLQTRGDHTLRTETLTDFPDHTPSTESSLSVPRGQSRLSAPGHHVISGRVSDWLSRRFRHHSGDGFRASRDPLPDRLINQAERPDTAGEKGRGAGDATLPHCTGSVSHCNRQTQTGIRDF